MPPACLGRGGGGLPMQSGQLRETRERTWLESLGPWAQGPWALGPNKSSKSNISAAWGGGSGVFGTFFDFLARDPQKMPARKCHCDHFAASFAPRTLTASPIVLRIIFKKMLVFLQTLFAKIDLFKIQPAPKPDRK